MVKIKDYLTSIETDLNEGVEEQISLPKSNVLQFFTEEGSKVSVRPSGTEPKIKFYFGVKAPLDDVASFEKVNLMLEQRIEKIKKDLGI